MNHVLILNNLRLQLFQVLVQNFKLFRTPDSNASPGQELLVWSEQGLGDSIQFCRYLLILKQLGIPFVYQTRDSLITLMRDWLGLGSSVISSDSQDLPDESRPHIPLLSLPHLLGADLYTVPSLNGYLRNYAQP